MNQNKIEKRLAQANEEHDEELLRLARLGNQEAFTDLYERYLPKVYKRVAFLIPNVDIEDVVQEVFIAMMRSLKTFRGDCKFSTWLRVITNRQIANYYRKNKKSMQDRDMESDESWLQRKPNPDHSTQERQEKKILVQQSLSKLPQHYREIILLRFAEGLKFKEIAELQEKSLDAVKSQFRRAIETLRKELGAPDAREQR